MLVVVEVVLVDVGVVLVFVMAFVVVVVVGVVVGLVTVLLLVVAVVVGCVPAICSTVIGSSRSLDMLASVHQCACLALKMCCVDCAHYLFEILLMLDVILLWYFEDCQRFQHLVSNQSSGANLYTV
jgi:hypothetical protein